MTLVALRDDMAEIQTEKKTEAMQEHHSELVKKTMQLTWLAKMTTTIGGFFIVTSELNRAPRSHMTSDG